jgi:hypothetical protein
MRSQPGAKQTPKAFHGVDVYFVDTVYIRVAGVLTLTVIDRDMDIAPGWQAGVNAVLVGIHRASLLDHQGDPRLDRRLPRATDIKMRCASMLKQRKKTSYWSGKSSMAKGSFFNS